MWYGINHPWFFKLQKFWRFASKKYNYFTQSKEILFRSDFFSAFCWVSVWKTLLPWKRVVLPEIPVVKASPWVVPCWLGSQGAFLQQLEVLGHQEKVTQTHSTIICWNPGMLQSLVSARFPRPWRWAAASCWVEEQAQEGVPEPLWPWMPKDCLATCPACGPSGHSHPWTLMLFVLHLTKALWTFSARCLLQERRVSKHYTLSCFLIRRMFRFHCPDFILGWQCLKRGVSL